MNFNGCAAGQERVMDRGFENSDVRQLCKAVSEEQDAERVNALLDELTEVLDERQLAQSLL
jgi:hypothetical protein